MGRYIAQQQACLTTGCRRQGIKVRLRKTQRASTSKLRNCHSQRYQQNIGGVWAENYIENATHFKFLKKDW